MMGFILFVDKVTAWAGKAFAWCILIMTFGVSYEVFVRYVLGDPTSWAFDISYMMYGTLFMMAGAYTLARDGHVRGDVVYRLWKPKTQAKVELVLYVLFFFPGILALIFAGWEYAQESWFYGEVSVMSPAETKPTSRTVVTDDDWMIEVTNAPAKAALNRFVVSRPSTRFMRSPATILRASVIWSRPNRNSARPPISLMMIVPISSVLVVAMGSTRDVLEQPAAARRRAVLNRVRTRF